MLHLADDVIARLVDRDDAEAAVWSAFAAWGHGEAATSPRVRAAMPGGDGTASAMAAVVPPYSGGKIYTTCAGRFTFVNVLFGARGEALATLDGDTITSLRTPAASSLAIHHLARPEPSIAAVIGTGLQAWPHVQMLGAALPQLAELRICARAGSAALAPLVERARAAGIAAVGHDDVGTAVDGAHVVVTVTTARRPVIPVDAIGDDALICAVGATKHDRAEIGAELVARCAAVVCDDVAGSRVESGDLIRAAAAGRFDWDRAIELHSVAAGTVVVPRAGRAPVLFETQGVAIQDVAVSALAYERYIREEPS